MMTASPVMKYQSMSVEIHRLVLSVFVKTWLEKTEMVPLSGSTLAELSTLAIIF